MGQFSKILEILGLHKTAGGPLWWPASRTEVQMEAVFVLIRKLIVTGMVLMSLGELHEVVRVLERKALASSRRGMMSLGNFNRRLMNPSAPKHSTR
jgi:hypothetical protein